MYVMFLCLTVPWLDAGLLLPLKQIFTFYSLRRCSPSRSSNLGENFFLEAICKSLLRLHCFWEGGEINVHVDNRRSVLWYSVV